MDCQKKSSLRITVNELVYAGLFAAVMLALQIALAPLPNIELVSLMVIVLAVSYGRAGLYAIYAFVLLQGLIYGFGIWWFSYLYVWAALYAAARLFRKNESAVFWALAGALFGLLFGALTSLPYLFIGGFYAALSYFIAGIPFDIAHCAGNFVLILILFHPFRRLAGKVNAHGKLYQENKEDL